MLNMNQFKHEFVNCCRDALKKNGVQGMRIIERKVNKPQCGELTGLIFKPRDSYCAPTLYVEQFYPAYLQGQSVYHLSQDAVHVVIDSLKTASMLETPEFDPKKGSADIRLRMLSLSRNKEFLKDVPYMDTGCGFALIADVIKGEFRANVSNELLEALEMSKEDLFNKAFRDSSVTEPAVLFRLTDAVLCGSADCENLLDTHFREALCRPSSWPQAEAAANALAGSDAANALAEGDVDNALVGGDADNALAGSDADNALAGSDADNAPAKSDNAGIGEGGSSDDSNLPLFVLTNSSSFWGSAVLFYPGVIDKIHYLLKDDFYILPSSVHELIILPAKNAEPEKLVGMIRSANETVVNCDEVLSDDLYICKAGKIEKVCY